MLGKIMRSSRGKNAEYAEEEKEWQIFGEKTPKKSEVDLFQN